MFFAISWCYHFLKTETTHFSGNYLKCVFKRYQKKKRRDFNFKKYKNENLVSIKLEKTSVV